MAVNWGLGQPEGGGYDYLQSLQQMGQIAAQKQAAAQNQYNFNRQRTADQQRPQILQQARGGNYSGAQDTAFANGDMDALKFVSSLQDTQRAQLGQHADAIAAVAANLAKLPADQRRAALAAAAPGLQRFGFTPEEIAAADVSDAGLTGYISAASSTKSALESYYDSQKPLTVADGAQVFGATPMGGGQRPLIAENPKDIVPQKPVWDSERGGWVYPPSAGAPTGSMTPLGGSAPQTGGGDLVSRMIPITLGSEGGGSLTNPKVSPKGARGPMQVMPGTNVSPGFGVTAAADGSEAERARVGRDYLAAMMQRYGGDPEKAWAAYNAGPGRVDALITKNGDRWKFGLPNETKDYIRKNMAALGSTPAPQSVPSGGGFVPVVPPKSKDYRILTPQEAQQHGLDPKSKWQIGPNQQITALPAKGDKPLTEIQAKSSGYLSTMLEASRSLSEVRGYTPNNVAIALDTLSNGNPIRGELSQTDRRVLNAQQAFAGASLRLESGAVITPEEIARKARALFPLPGDGPDVQRDKRRQREAAIKAMRIAAGPGSDQFAPLGDTSKTGANASRPQPKAGWKITERK